MYEEFDPLAIPGFLDGQQQQPTAPVAHTTTTTTTTTTTSSSSSSSSSSSTKYSNNLPLGHPAVQAWMQTKALDDSFVNDLFDYQVQTQLFCRICNRTVSARYETGRYVLAVPFPEEMYHLTTDQQLAQPAISAPSVELMDCLKLYFLQNQPVDDYRCSQCGCKQCVIQNTYLSSFPVLLPIQLKRRGLKGKTNCKVRVPVELDLSAFCSSSTSFLPNYPTAASASRGSSTAATNSPPPPPPTPPTAPKYRLYALVRHIDPNQSRMIKQLSSGGGGTAPSHPPQATTANSGHYTAFCLASPDQLRGAGSSIEAEHWCHFDDSKVKAIPPHAVDNIIFKENAQVTGLFYQLVTDSE